MNRQLQFLAILFVFSLFIALIFAADPGNCQLSDFIDEN